MKNKTISYRSSKLLKELKNAEKSFFTISEAADFLSTENSNTVRELLRGMAKRGLILRIKEGLYSVIPYEADSEKYFPNWHLTAEAIVDKKEYYVGFYSAMDIHGLITQPSLKEQVVVHERIKPKIITTGNVKFEFITYNDKHFFGYNKFWIDDFHKVNCSDIEKTIIDSLYKPGYSGGIGEIVKAIHKAKSKIDPKKLLEYTDRFNAQVVMKRLGYLLHNMNLFGDIVLEMKKRISNSYAYLDPSFGKEGKHISDFKIVDNIGIEEKLKGLGT